jgi:hypothetical protein
MNCSGYSEFWVHQQSNTGKVSQLCLTTAQRFHVRTVFLSVLQWIYILLTLFYHNLTEWKTNELTNVVEYLGPYGAQLWKVKMETNVQSIFSLYKFNKDHPLSQTLLAYDPAHRISAKAVSLEKSPIGMMS